MISRICLICQGPTVPIFIVVHKCIALIEHILDKRVDVMLYCEDHLVISIHMHKGLTVPVVHLHIDLQLCGFFLMNGHLVELKYIVAVCLYLV